MNNKLFKLAIFPLVIASLTGCKKARTIDDDIKDFLDEINVTVPALKDYNMTSEVFYSYTYKQYAIGAYVETTEALDEQYVAKLTADTGFVSGNDETYTVEDYGYIYADSLTHPNVELYFGISQGDFYITLWRVDGEAGKLDVSGVDTSWYVDLVRDYGYQVIDAFPSEDINSKLSIDATLVNPNAEQYCSFFEEAHVDEYYGDNIPNTYNLMAKGDIAESYAEALDEAGYNVESSQDIDWDTGDEFTIYHAYDSAKKIYISITPGSDYTQIVFNKLSDLFTFNLTENTDWTDEEKATMNDFLGEPLPFIQLGDDYVVGVGNFFLDYLYIEDSYIENLGSSIEQMLIDAGYVLDGDYGVYLKVTDEGEYEANFGYDEGNSLIIYFFPAKE